MNLRGLGLFIFGLILCFVMVLVEGAHLEIFLHWVGLILLLIPFAIGLIVTFAFREKISLSKKILEATMNITWLVAVLISAISLSYVMSHLGDANAAQLGHGIALVVCAGLFAGFANILYLFPTYAEISLKESNEQNVSSVAGMNGLAAIMIGFMTLMSLFLILYALSSDSPNPEPASSDITAIENQDTSGDTHASASSSGSSSDTFLQTPVTLSTSGVIIIIIFWLMFIVDMGLPNRFTNVRLWIFSAGYILGIGSILFLMGIIVILSNLGMMSAQDLGNGIAQVNGILAFSLGMALFSILISIVIGILSMKKA